MIRAEAIELGFLAHAVGDYVVQSDWMAIEKTKRWFPAFIHGFTYGLPFLILTRNPLALAIIIMTHVVIDRYRLARYVIWAKNQLLQPRSWAQPWGECHKTGYSADRPEWLSVWLMIIADNTLHVGINTAVIWWIFR